MLYQRWIFPFFLLSSLLLGTTIAQTDQFLANYCLNTGNYTSNGMYQTSLNTALSSLSSNTTKIGHGGFYNFSSGRKPDRVTVIGLCRGDVGPNDCRSCLDVSSGKLRELCPNQKEAIGWTDDCMIRYSNRSILHANETLPYAYVYNIKNASNPTEFNKVVRNLLDRLRPKAAAGGSMLKYATGNMTSAALSGTKIYGLAQCTPDLSPAQCSNCLDGAFEVLPQCCDGKIGGRGLRPSCHFRYEINHFYGKNAMPNAPPPENASPPTEAAAPPPPPPLPENASPPPPPPFQNDSPPTEAAAPPPPDSQMTPPISSTPVGAPPTTPQVAPPPPPPQGGGGRSLAFVGVSALMVAVPAILVL